MIDSKLILNNKKHIQTELAKKGYDIEYIDAIEQVMLEIRKQKTHINALNKKRNEISSDKRIDPIEKRKLRKHITHCEKDLKALEKYTQKLLHNVPNLPDPNAPIGHGESDNVIIDKSEDHYICAAENPLPHWEISDKLNIWDPQAAGTISGSGFCMLKGKGAKLLRALINYCFTLNEENYTEILPPHLVTSQSLTHTGHLPEFYDEQYQCKADDLWLIPTAEVPLTAAFANTTFPIGSLPERRIGYSISFRRETGASGRDTRGLQRLHEFHKVEVLKITEPEMLDAELSAMCEDCLKIIKKLKLQYRVIDLCTGEMGHKYARCYDIEVYAPGIQKWLEVSSVGHFSDYQARRANIRYLDKNGKIKFAYTMNGSAMATPRVWLAIIETYQQPDGTIKVPDELVPFMGCTFID
ncbi:MAG: serine--tRNA ligase [Oscillospiraceae bacterium]|nr:serine--tRNA ligase [Oscillospiraceae bacterium]